jgi:Ca-activated chloride channel family protein
MRFSHPEALWLLFALPVLAGLMVAVEMRRRRALIAFAGSALADKLARGMSAGRRLVKALLVLLGVAFLIVACARPRFGTRLEELPQRGLDLMIGLDVSNSMLAEDVRPNRLARAKAEVAALIDRLSGDQVGLIAFAGVSFVQCPLTVDYAAARMLLDAMGPELIPVGGTAIAECIRTAREAFTTREHKYKVLILITDGEDTRGGAEAAAAEAAKESLRIYTIGVGRVDGAPIPVKDERGATTHFRKDERGNVVTSRLDAATLQRVAEATGGRFYRASVEEGELEKILKEIEGLERRELKTRTLSHMEDRFQIFVILALACLVLDLVIPERRPERGPWGGRFA